VDHDGFILPGHVPSRSVDRAPSNEGGASNVGGDLKTGAISTNSIPQDDAKKIKYVTIYICVCRILLMNPANIAIDVFSTCFGVSYVNSGFVSSSGVIHPGLTYDQSGTMWICT